MSFKVRTANQNDLDQISQIYNWAVLNTTATFDLEPKTASQQIDWFKNHECSFPVIVATQAEKEPEIVVGWASLSPWSDRCAYAKSAEVSVYVDPNFHRKGVGKTLLNSLIKEAKAKRLETLLARISQESLSSIKLHESLGFEKAGLLKSVGEKFGRKLDVAIYQKMI